jgi:hypothetical protein
MAIDIKSGDQVTLTVNKSITRAGARKTLERLFLMDKAVRTPIETRAGNFKEQPKRRGGPIWTRRPNKLHPELIKGASATIKASPQTIKDLKSVEAFIDVKSA